MKRLTCANSLSLSHFNLFNGSTILVLVPAEKILRFRYHGIIPRARTMQNKVCYASVAKPAGSAECRTHHTGTLPWVVDGECPAEC
jgi:hypothetical protein